MKGKNILENQPVIKPLSEYFLEAFKLCLERNNLVFDKTFFIQVDSTVQDPHIRYIYGYNMYQYNIKTTSYQQHVVCCKRFTVDSFMFCNHSRGALDDLLFDVNDFRVDAFTVCNRSSHVP